MFPKILLLNRIELPRNDWSADQIVYTFTKNKCIKGAFLSKIVFVDFDFGLWIFALKNALK